MMKLFDPEISQPLQLRPQSLPVPLLIEESVVSQLAKFLTGEAVLLVAEMDQHDSDSELSNKSTGRENRIFVL